MEPDKAKECLNRHLLENPIEKAVALAYREIMTDIFESFNLELDKKKKQAIANIVEALSETSCIPEKTEEISCYGDPENFKAIGIIYTKLISFLEYVLENHESLPNEEAKEVWDKGNIKQILDCYNKIWTSHQNCFIENGQFFILRDSMNSIIKLLYFGFRLILGAEITHRLVYELNSSLSVLNPYINQLVAAMNQSVPQKPS